MNTIMKRIALSLLLLSTVHQSYAFGCDRFTQLFDNVSQFVVKYKDSFISGSIFMGSIVAFVLCTKLNKNVNRKNSSFAEFNNDEQKAQSINETSTGILVGISHVTQEIDYKQIDRKDDRPSLLDGLVPVQEGIPLRRRSVPSYRR